jgi:hypothetical protein
MTLLSWIAARLDKLLPTRRGSGQCACGAVRFDLTVPGSSYGLLDQGTAICHCKDCVGFAKALGANGELVLTNNATQMVQFYQSDVEIVQGESDVGALKLRNGTLSIRLYCRRCGTPLGLQASHPVPIIGIYHHLLRSRGDYEGGELPVVLPWLVFNYDSALPGTRPYGGCAVVKRGMLAPLFIIRVIGRILLGLAFSKSGNGLLAQDVDVDSIPLGLESIAVSKKKDQ